MKIPEDCKCRICKSFYCCSYCRIRHELSVHAIRAEVIRPIESTDNNSGTQMAEIDIFYILCPLCQKKPFALRAFLHRELLEHIEEKHLPLQCQKCNKLYTKIDDLRAFSKCLNMAEKCEGQESSTSTDQTDDTDTSKDTVKQAPVAHSTMSTQTSPFLERNQSDKDLNETDQLTPISIINMRWKAKSKVTHEEFISDSVSSIKNLSTVSNNSLRRSITQVPTTVTKGKLIRSTSTPLQVDTLFAKSKEPTFNASGGHVSSIYSSGIESEHSPAAAHAAINGTPAQTVENVNRYRKVGARGKMSAVTPLRQVMSKSIQKAFVEHGGLPRCSNLQRRNMFDTTDNSAHDSNSIHSVLGDEAAVVPLDLRLSPAVRRTQSEGDFGCELNSKCKNLQINNKEIRMLSSQKCTTMKSIVITRTKVVAANVATSSTSSVSAYTDMTGNGSSSSHSSDSGSANGTSTNSVYKSCESVEIITATAEMSSVNMAGINSAPPLTPITRLPGAVINKKLIKFETPVKEKKTETDVNAFSQLTTPDEKFFTPNSGTPARNLNLEKNNSNDRKKSVVRQLTDRFSPPKPRERLRGCSQIAAFNRIEHITDDLDKNDVDDVFLSDKESTKQEIKKPTPQQEQGAGRLWTLMTSVMRLPKFKTAGTGSTQKDDSTSLPDANSISILKRCASIAGSLVRPRPMYDDDQIKPMKRKRTHTLDNCSSYPSPTFNYTDPVSPPPTSIKRIRIQSRKPIERMRLDS